MLKSTIDEAKEVLVFPRISRHHDIIVEAIVAYDGYMLDDDYDAQAALDQIMARMRDRLFADTEGEAIRTLLASHASLEEGVKPLVAAAQLVVDQTNDIHENDPPPIKYRAPYGAIANLTRALAAFLDQEKEAGRG